ncbi:hypothetical protein [Streptomyces marincola]|uniref:hypothetical protein n=1 Tax=Streptomyces marincola TaxID=2878388 RepID=UPI001CF3C489|nr:hypothetical protein [Streptomyces marincola]UCM87477.1 hypothetical protein LC193_05685 [Streptomyces marincola]
MTDRHIASSAHDMSWMPREGPAPLPCGRWWDGVQLPTITGTQIIGHLRERSGPVVEDQATGLMTWLIPVGAADAWEPRRADVSVLGAGRVLLVPPVEWSGGPWHGGFPTRWLIPPRETCLTGPADLFAALRTVSPSHGQRGVARRLPAVRQVSECASCGGLDVVGVPHRCPDGHGPHRLPLLLSDIDVRHRLSWRQRHGLDCALCARRLTGASRRPLATIEGQELCACAPACRP